MAFLNNLKPVDYVAAPRLLFLLASAPHVLLLFASVFSLPPIELFDVTARLEGKHHLVLFVAVL
jgi:hypothetical protein